MSRLRRGGSGRDIGKRFGGGELTPGKERWHELHCARFIRWLKPRRLREAGAQDATEWLRLVAGQPDTAVWKVRQADKALPVLMEDMLGMSWAVRGRVAASTQNQALNALVFFFREGLKERCQIVVWDGKGARDGVTMLPGIAAEGLQADLAGARRQHDCDLAAGHGKVYLPAGLARKRPNAERE